MKIAMIGAKGVPATHGGIERHVEELGSRLAAMGHDVVVFTRTSYTDPKLVEYAGMRLVSLPTIGTKHLDAIVHSILASFAVWRGGFDVIHYHGVGPCLASPIGLVGRRRLVATIHAQDWQRAKWGRFARAALRFGKWLALTIPHATIAVSRSIVDCCRAEGHRVEYIPNGVTVERGDDPSILEELGVSEGQYILFAGRLVPEKGPHYLIQAHADSGLGAPLVVAGDTSHSDAYVLRLRASSGTNVVFAGYRYGPQLAALFRHAGLFVLPSDVEGLPLVLLEALGYGVPVLASDIPANVEVLGCVGTYFPAGDVGALTRALGVSWEHRRGLREAARQMREKVLREYDWDAVAEKTESVYRTIAGGRTRGQRQTALR